MKKRIHPMRGLMVFTKD